ncbi:MAG: ADP-ribosylglycohydrolase family protein [Spirochaetales bacterium]|nr:ADP-ribosylglycohydrolase family protein [Spirochaetales bacterium]
MRNKDKFRGCLIGGAAGDALGYAVEFMSLEQIRQRYGSRGITDFVLTDGAALISDDTQMTLFTANGLLIRTTRGMGRGIAANPQDYCWYCYKAWLKTQESDFHRWKSSVKDVSKEYPWLIRVPELHSARAPGNTVLRSLRADVAGTRDNPLNSSKGCGGLMRVAPVGLYFEERDIYINRICIHGANIAALTHGHPLGYIPAAAFVYLINRITYCEQTEPELKEIVTGCIAEMNTLFQGTPHIDEFISIMEKAVELSESDMDDESAISLLGEGWVAEETLAIAIYCVLRYRDNFEKALVASVNHSGDSDSTGSVAGNLMGALHGYDRIPEKFKCNLELKDIILEIADDLCSDCTIDEYSINTEEDDRWYWKYSC